jgi:hypothetical protein
MAFISVPCTDGYVFQRGGFVELTQDAPQAPKDRLLGTQGRGSKSKSQITSTGSSDFFRLTNSSGWTTFGSRATFLACTRDSALSLGGAERDDACNFRCEVPFFFGAGFAARN